VEELDRATDDVHGHEEDDYCDDCPQHAVSYSRIKSDIQGAVMDGIGNLYANLSPPRAAAPPSPLEQRLRQQLSGSVLSPEMQAAEQVRCISGDPAMHNQDAAFQVDQTYQQVGAPQDDLIMTLMRLLGAR
jgi:hypothetical protein